MPDHPPATLVPLPAIVVPFKGERSGAGRLTCGQRNILEWVARAAEPFDSTIGVALPIPGPTPVTALVDSLAALLARHEGLRTTFETGDPPVQRVHDRGELAVAAYRVGPQPPEQGPALAETLGRTWRPHQACGMSQLPLWVAFAIESDVAYAGYARFSHLAVDFQAVQILGGELAEMLRDPLARVPGPPRHQPLDQADLERTPKLRRRTTQALGHWESQLRRIQPCLYPAPATGESAEVGEAAESVAVEIFSPAAALALRRVAARTGRSRPSAVLAAVCALLARRTGYPELRFPTLAGNRFERHLAGYVGTLAQATVAAVQVGDARFDELVRLAALAVLRASRHGIYEIVRSIEITQTVERERGVRVPFEPMFNSPAVDPPDAAAAPPTLAQVHAALPRTRLGQAAMRPTPSQIRFDLFDCDEPMHLSLWTGDTARLGVEEATELLLAVERLLVAAAAGDLSQAQTHAALGVAPIPYGPGWLLVDGVRVELAEVQRLLDDVFAPAPARIFPEAAGERLVAYLVADDSLRTPAQAHQLCMAALAGRPTAMAPRRYRLWAEPPGDPGDAAGWSRLVGDGTGREVS